MVVRVNSRSEYNLRTPYKAGLSKIFIYIQLYFIDSGLTFIFVGLFFYLYTNFLIV